jgi:hypothetical protein
VLRRALPVALQVAQSARVAAHEALGRGAVLQERAAGDRHRHLGATQQVRDDLHRHPALHGLRGERLGQERGVDDRVGERGGGYRGTEAPTVAWANGKWPAAA